jgi:hypothetical protein
MRLLVLIKSSSEARDSGKHSGVRALWTHYRTVVTPRFFIQTPANKSHKSGGMKSDETEIEPMAGDTDAVFTRNIFQWAKSKLFDYVFVQDINSIIDPQSILNTRYDRADYTGRFSWPLGEQQGHEYSYKGTSGFIPNAFPYALGGFGYFLSYDAVSGLSERIPALPYSDLWVGQVIGEHVAKGLATAQDLNEENNV